MKIFITNLVLVVLFLSLYGPRLFGNIYLYQIIAIPTVLIMLIINLSNTVNKKYIISIILLIVILVTYTIYLIGNTISNGTFILSSSSIGGLEAYLEIFVGVFFAHLLNKYKFTLESFCKFILNTLMPIAILSILLYILNPEQTMVVINTYMYGTSETGQWRFTGFYGLPYYAAVGYLLFLFVIVLFYKKEMSLIKKFYFLISFVIITIGGLLAASKTFFIGFAILLLFIIYSSKNRLSTFLKLLSITLVSIFFILSIALEADSEFSKIFNLVSQYSISSIYDAVVFRYSSENTAIMDALSDYNWNEFVGVGSDAQSIATDSQYRDVLYRFGFFGLAAFMIFLLSVFIGLSIENRFFFIMLAIGALGSNTFTPIGSTLLIWTMFFLSILERKKIVFKYN